MTGSLARLGLFHIFDPSCSTPAACSPLGRRRPLAATTHRRLPSGMSFSAVACAAFAAPAVLPRLMARAPPPRPVPSRRPRAPPTIAARSLDSYREGRRDGPARREYDRVDGGDGGDGAGDVGQQKPRPPRTKIGLLKALVRANVASGETCATLVRGGLVAVNGLVKTDGSIRVDIEQDVVTVRGREVSFPVAGDEGGGRDDEDENDTTLTRAQKDFRKGRFGEQGRADKAKKYTRQVDGGFYSGKRWSAGK
jgi:hypothetical protein